METFLMTWNPKKWAWDDIEDRIKKIEENGFYSGRWSCSRNINKIIKGSRIFIIRLGQHPKGIIGSAWVKSDKPDKDDHWLYEGKKAWYVKIDYDNLTTEPLLTLDFLNSNSPFNRFRKGFKSWTPQGSGVRIPPDIADALKMEWAKRTPAKLSARKPKPEEINEDASFLEGTLHRTTITRPERNPQARKACLEHYGKQCIVCGFSFDEFYGGTGLGYLIAHHLYPFSESDGKERQVDPVADLRPVCPNCHSVIHSRKPIYSIPKVKNMINRNK